MSPALFVAFDPGGGYAGSVDLPIERNPEISGGSPVTIRTRVQVATRFDHLLNGLDPVDLPGCSPTVKDI